MRRIALALALVACISDAPVMNDGSTNDAMMVDGSADGGGGGDTSDASKGLGAPTGVTAAADVSKGAHVTWTAPTMIGNGIKSYTVTAMPGATTVKTPDAMTMTALFTNLMVGTTYTFTVHADDGAPGPESMPSNGVKIVGPGLPGAGGCSRDGGLVAIWPPVMNAASYNLYWGASPGVTKASGMKGANVMNPAIVKNLMNGTPYYFAVTYVDMQMMESDLSDETTVTPSKTVVDMAVASSFSQSKVEIFDCFSLRSSGFKGGNRGLSGNMTQLQTTNYFNVWIDSVASSLYVSSGYNAPFRVDIWNNVTTIDGNVPPDREITGNNTGLTQPYNVILDKKHDILFVLNRYSSVLLFANGSTANGNVAPKATITGVNTKLTSAYGLYVDETNDRIYVANTASVLVFDSVSMLSGMQNVAPTRVIDISASTGAGYALSVDAGKNILYVGVRDNNKVLVFDNASNLSGAPTPNRIIAGPATGAQMEALALKDTLYTFTDSAIAINVWANASTLNGNNLMPTKVIGLNLMNGGGFAIVP